MTDNQIDDNEISSSENEGDEVDSDEELQEAFAAGLIQPGLNTVLAPKDSDKPKTNNIDGLKQKYEELALKLPWMEKLDSVNKAAPLAPELAYQEEQHAKRREKLLKGNQKNAVELADDPIHNDFKREMLFYRQAQATVLSALEIFRAKKIPTKRPEDYFAQMFKTDEHMQKIRTKLAQKQDEEDRISKVRKLRELKKIGKKVQVEKLQKRQKEKKDMLDQVKKFRKGKTDKIDFLEDLNSKNGGGKTKPSNKKQFKDKKFGFGGKKKGGKSNTKDSTNNFSSKEFGRSKKKHGGQMKNKRPGKQKTPAK